MSQADRLLRWLRAHPDSTILEITYGLHPFVSNPRARMSDLREQGHRIVWEGRPARFRLIEAPAQMVAFG